MTATDEAPDLPETTRRALDLPNADEVLAELAKLRETIDAADEARKRRLELWLYARLVLEPKITFLRLATESGVAEPYVIREVGANKPRPAKQARKSTKAKEATTS